MQHVKWLNWITYLFWMAYKFLLAFEDPVISMTKQIASTATVSVSKVVNKIQRYGHVLRFVPCFSLFQVKFWNIKENKCLTWIANFHQVWLKTLFIILLLKSIALKEKKYTLKPFLRLCLEYVCGTQQNKHFLYIIRHCSISSNY